jgi:tRNA threonylcarbamoyladenosine biosynthesis protein TsaB
VGCLELNEKSVSLRSWRTIEEPHALARLLIGTIDSVLAECGWKLQELDGIGVGIGPGSWTSLRIGITTAKTLAQATKLPLCAQPSFDALAVAVHEQQAPGEPTLLLVISPCKPGEYYGKLYRVQTDMLAVAQSEWIAPMTAHLDASAAQMLADGLSEPLLVAGPSAADAAAALLERAQEYQVIAVVEREQLLHLGLTAARCILEDEDDELLSVTPLYLAASSAERNFKRPARSNST